MFNIFLKDRRSVIVLLFLVVLNTNLNYSYADDKHLKGSYIQRVEELKAMNEKFKSFSFIQIDIKNEKIVMDFPRGNEDKRIKLYFKNNQGDLYLFKTRKKEEQSKVYSELIGNWISFALGADLIPVFYKEVYWQGDLLKGVMVPLLVDSRTLTVLDILHLSQEQVDQLIQNEVIDIFVMNEDIGFTNYLVQTDHDFVIKELVRIDKDDAFTSDFLDYVIKKDKCFEVYNSLWKKNYIAARKAFYSTGKKTASYIENLSDHELTIIFEQVRNDLPSKVVFDAWSNLLLERKRNFLQTYIVSCQKIHPHTAD